MPVQTSSPALGGGATDPEAKGFDHGKGQPLVGICSISEVKWKEVPALFGLEQFLQVADAAEAHRRGVRSFAIQAPQYIDANKDGETEIAMVPVLHWAPDGTGGMKQWGEVTFFLEKNCKVGSTLLIRSGPKP